MPGQTRLSLQQVSPPDLRKGDLGHFRGAANTQLPPFEIANIRQRPVQSREFPSDLSPLQWMTTEKGDHSPMSPQF